MGLLRPVGMSFICHDHLLKVPQWSSAPRPEKAIVALVLYTYLLLFRPTLMCIGRPTKPYSALSVPSFGLAHLGDLLHW